MQSTSPEKPDNTASDRSLRRYLGYRLKRAYGAIRYDLLERLEPLGLRITTFSTLSLIVDNLGVRQSVLASELDIKSSNMVAIIDDLEGRGWIKRNRMPSDRRAFALHATAAGIRICKKAAYAANENESVALSRLTEEEIETLSGLLEKIESPGA